jgi:hypothetical protein
MRNLATTTLLPLNKRNEYKIHISCCSFIILILILSEINNIKTKQQLQNDRYKAEERLKDSK